jgi:hypothetical protein
MEPQDYWDKEPSEDDADLDINKLIGEIYKGFMQDLEIAAGIAKGFPENWQLDILMNIMKDI